MRSITTLVTLLAMTVPAWASPTPRIKCEAAKLDALRKRDFCSDGERRNEVLGRTSDAANCLAKFASKIARIDEAAAKKGTSCRWLVNGDGTATDLNTGLQWELKTGPSDGVASAMDPHDVDNTYTWNTKRLGTKPNGTVFKTFLGTLNGGAADLPGAKTKGCFAGKCDWRLPTIEELRGILDAAHPDCSIDPCTTIPGFTASWFHWSSSTVSLIPSATWDVDFFDGLVSFTDKKDRECVRAVRGGP